MIIKTKAIRTGGTGRVVNYVQQLGENELVELMAGEPSAFSTVDLMADLNGQKHSILHITINPKTELSAAGLQLAIDEIYDEFGIEEDGPFVLARHVKIREDGKNDASHYHLLVPASDSAGQGYKMWRSKKRDEAISRACELRLGHDVVPGAHNDFVLDHFRQQSRHDLAVEFEAALNGDRSPRVADYSSAMNHLIKRQDTASLKQMVQAMVGDLKGKPIAEIASGLAGIESHFPDLEFAAGTKRGSSTLGVYLDGKFLAGVRRQLGSLKKEDIEQILKIKGDYKNGRIGESGRGEPGSDRQDRRQNGRHLQPSGGDRSGSGSIAPGGDAGGDPRGADAAKARRDRNRRHAADDHAGDIRSQGGSGRPSSRVLSPLDRAAGSLAARRIRLRLSRDTQTSVRIHGADKRTGDKLASRPDIKEKRSELVMQGPRPTISKADDVRGNKAAEALKTRRPFLGGKGKIRVSHRDRLLGSKASGRLSELRRQHKEYMATPLNLSGPSQPGVILDLDDPLLMQKLSEQLKASLGTW